MSSDDMYFAASVPDHQVAGIWRSACSALTAAAVVAAPPRQAVSDEAIPGGWHYRQASGTADGRGFDLRDLPHSRRWGRCRSGHTSREWVA